MQTRREALVAAGLAKPGRGKFSGAALAWLDAQRAAGVKFSDDDGPVKAVKPTETDKPTAPAPVDPRNSHYYLPDEYRFPEKEYRAFHYVDGKKVAVSLREACNKCRVSLVNHMCNTPTIHSGVPVTIEPVKV